MTFAAIVVTIAQVAGSAAAEVRQELQAIYDRAAAASVAAKTLTDLDAIHSWLDTPDCRFKDTGRPFETWDQMRGYAERGLHTRIVSFSSTIQSLEADGGVIVATAVVRGVARITDERGDFGAKGSVHNVETTATVRDRWIKTDRWRRQTHEKIVANAVTAVDGKAIRPRL